MLLVAETHSSVGQLNAGAPLLLVLTKKHLGRLMFPEHERRQQLGLGRKRRHGSVKRKQRGSGLTSGVLAGAAWLAKVPRRLSGSELKNQQ